MPRVVVAISGSIGSGKSTLAQALVNQYGAVAFSSRALVAQQVPAKDRTRRNLQAAGDRLERTTKGQWLKDSLVLLMQGQTAEIMAVIDAVRTPAQLEALRDAWGRRVVHVHLTAPRKVLSKRHTARRKASDSIDDATPYEKVLEDPTEQQIEQLRHDADIVIDTERSMPEAVVVRAACRLGLIKEPTEALVDVIVGGQYGSEGKGNIAYHVAPEYDLLVRVGGPNAGHKVITSGREEFTHRLLPSGTLACDAPLLIGPGAVLDLDVLLDEIADCSVGVERLSIDPQAMMISDADKKAESTLVGKIGSTGKGGGAALARRIQDRHTPPKLARDIPALKPYLREAAEVLEAAFTAGERVLLEGTQGTALSLYHGHYPHVTSRDTTASGCLAEAGIPPTRVRKTIMVCRSYPIRVMSPDGGDSGEMGLEVKWADIARRSGLKVKDLEGNELGSVSKKLRRVAEFDWKQLRRAATLNGPTDIALTFADYLDKQNQNARRYDQLTADTIRFIEEVEQVSSAPVSIISTRFHERCIIDRRTW